MLTRFRPAPIAGMYGGLPFFRLQRSFPESGFTRRWLLSDCLCHAFFLNRRELRIKEAAGRSLLSLAGAQSFARPVS